MAADDTIHPRDTRTSNIGRRRANAKQESGPAYEARRAEIMAAAANVFLAKGYSATSFKDIAEALDVMFREEGGGLLPNLNRYRRAPDLKPGTTVENAHVVEFIESTTPWAVGYLWTGKYWREDYTDLDVTDNYLVINKLTLTF